jgi:DhnA family fructose-bisphosphate aldolase class Ia
MSCQPRLNRLFSASRRCLDVAIDHGAFLEASFLEGLEDMPAVVRTLVAARPDALQMNVGQADLLQSIPGPQKPALVLRLDAGSVYNTPAQLPLWDALTSPEAPLDAALRLDAACVVVNLLSMDGMSDLHRQTVANIGRLRPLCDRYGMPLMVEPLVLGENGCGGYRTCGPTRALVTLTRLARELGADIVKADPTDQPADFHLVVEAARCPVLVRGGGRQSLDVVLQAAETLLAQGASGLVFGRNVFQHPDPARVVTALKALVHQGSTAGEAWQLYEAQGG